MNQIRRVALLIILTLSICGVKVYADETYEKLKTMIDVMELIKTNYVTDKQALDLASGAIRGVVSTLDPFSQYMEEKAFSAMKDETEGAFSGIGIRIMSKDGFVTVVSPIPDSPAYKAGILPGDRIIRIDGKDASKMTQDEAVSLMKGKLGTKVKVTMSRDRVAEPIDFVLRREKIKIETVRSTVLNDNIIYIRLGEFNAKSADDIKKVLEDSLKEDTKGLILDLRNNPGGLLESAIAIISMFIKDKTVALTTKGRHEEQKREYLTTGDGKYVDLPFAILVNMGSASASEIVTGAMQDFKRALILGANTFGKGSVQTLFPLSDGTALRLTIAKYYLPSGRPIIRNEGQNVRNGITPDIEFKISIEDEIRLYTQSDIVFIKNKKVEVVGEEEVKEEKDGDDKDKEEEKKDDKKVEKKKEKAEDDVLKFKDVVLYKALELMKEDKIAVSIASSTALDKDKEADKREKEAKEAQEKKLAEEAKERKEKEAKEAKEKKKSGLQIDENKKIQTDKKVDKSTSTTDTLMGK